jgi:hypothetical protein
VDLRHGGSPLGQENMSIGHRHPSQVVPTPTTHRIHPLPVEAFPHIAGGSGITNWF